MKHSKRILSVILALIMMFTLLVPVATAATSSTTVKVTAATVAKTGKIKLTWNAVKNAKSYAVYRATSKSGTYSKISTVKGTSLTNTSVTVGKTYYYQVKALNASGKVISTSAKVSKLCVCATPVVTAGNKASTGKITLKWAKVTGAAKYEVYRSTSKTGTFSKILTTTGVSCANTSAKVGTTYYYKVKAIASNTKANSAFSAVVSRACDCAQPVITVGNDKETGKNTVSWKKVDSATKYELYRATSKSGTYSNLATLNAASFSNSTITYTDTSSKAAKQYYYKVRALCSNSSSTSAYSEIKNRMADLPMMKDILVDYNDNGNIIFTWSKVSGATGYKISRSDTENGKYTVVGNVKDCKFTDTTAKVGQYYYYKLTAVSSVSSSAESAPVEGPALPLYPKVKNIKDVSTDRVNKIQWSKVEGVDGYVILRGTSQDLEQMEPLAGVAQPLLKSTCNFTDESRIHGVYYAIVGVKDMGEGNDPIPSVPVFFYVG